MQFNLADIEFRLFCADEWNINYKDLVKLPDDEIQGLWLMFKKNIKRG